MRMFKMVAGGVSEGDQLVFNNNEAYYNGNCFNYHDTCTFKYVKVSS